MFLDWFGKLCFSHMRPSFFYLTVLSPLFFSCLYILLQYNSLDELEHRFSDACKKGKIALTRKGRKERFLNRYSHADPYFLDNQIESLTFLQKEKRELEALRDHPALADKRSIEERLAFLKSDQNRLAFTEEAISTASRIKETEERQRHPVEIEEDDLKKLLSLIEDVPIDSFSPVENAPQVIITDFNLKKKTKVLEIEMKLLTREFSK
jgi:hypothetical protein